MGTRHLQHPRKNLGERQSNTAKGEGMANDYLANKLY
jgi:hypothetical protein